MPRKVEKCPCEHGNQDMYVTNGNSPMLIPKDSGMTAPHYDAPNVRAGIFDDVRPCPPPNRMLGLRQLKNPVPLVKTSSADWTLPGDGCDGGDADRRRKMDAVINQIIHLLFSLGFVAVVGLVVTIYILL